MKPNPEGAGPGPQTPRVRVDRLILFTVLTLLLFFLGGYFLLRRATHFSWPYITNSVLLSVLFLTNAILVLTLLTLLMRNLIKALVERRRGILGSRFRTKLVFSLLLLWLVPSGIIFYAAMHLIQRSVDRWFNEPMDRLTDASQEIVDAYFDDARARDEDFARQVAQRVRDDGLLRAGVTRSDLHRAMGRYLREYRLDLVAIDRSRDASYLVLDPHLPTAGGLEEVPADRMEAAFRGEPFSWMSEFRGGHLIRCGHPVRDDPAGPVLAVVTVGTYVPRDLSRLAAAITRSNEDYRQMRAQKGLIKRVYVLVFALITLLVLFSVTWIGLYLARRITEPIQSLAQGTREISSGNLGYRVEVRAGDELGILVDSFNRMTAEIQAGRETIERSNTELSASNRELMERRRYMETLLQNLTTAVISLDREGRVTTINRAAQRLLELEGETEPVGRPLAPLIPAVGREAIGAMVDAMLAGSRAGMVRQVDLQVGARTLSLAVSATALRGDAGEVLGAILVIEDMTDLMRAQKIAAWREVARRLAHEIKNPLTPIQLSAERILKKYEAHSDDLDEIVAEGTAAIVREVAALKNLVDEFSRFARLPAPQPVLSDLQEVVGSALSLYDGVHSEVHIEPRCDPDLPRVPIDPEQMKRALVNLLDNAVAAIGGRGTVTIGARRDTATGAVILEVSDDGPGIRPEDRDRLFLPYFSTKKQGSGLGLAIVHRIVTDHGGRIRVEDNQPHGARFIIELPAPAA
ncbi:MAG TPA: ATP-binding protein [Candidatus Polarisedimenticolia bacterium]|nr:ATP-binding protein [Candidatus Polarisedimenticolia bacterium]